MGGYHVNRVLLVAAFGALGGWALKHGRQQVANASVGGKLGTSKKCGTVERLTQQVELAQGLIEQALKSPDDAPAQQIAMASFSKLVLDPEVAVMNVTSFNSLAQASSQLKALESRLLTETSMFLNDVLQSAADKASSGTATYEFLRTLRLCSACNDYVRVGESHDGGYIICADGLSQGLRSAYSYGINGVDGWGLHMVQAYNIPVYEYDCFNTVAPFPAIPSMHFFPECIKGPQEVKPANYKSFTQHVVDNGQATFPDNSIMLKIDVEGAEYPALEQETAAALRQVRHLNLELHNVGDTTKHDLYLRAMKSVLNAGFSVTHLHGNNWGHMNHHGQFSYPDALEVTLVRGPNSLTGQCAQTIPYHIPEDSTCNRYKMELPDAVLPNAA